MYDTIGSKGGRVKNKLIMKIGIITLHRAHNYGAVLQCYALLSTLRKISGMSVEVIDYRQSYIEDNYAVFSIRQFFRKLHSPRSILSYIIDIRKRSIRKRNFENFCNNHIIKSRPCKRNTIPQDYDIYVVGSDQLWATNVMRCADKVYWGYFLTNLNARKFTYAISSNNKSLEELGCAFVKHHAKNFKTLSFREKDIANMVEKMTGEICRQDIDPVLLTDQDDWNELIDEKWASRNYVLVYQIGSPQGDPNLLLSKAKNMVGNGNLEVIDLTPKLLSPEDFVSAFRYARFVLTTSFHGTAFSILFNRPFYTISVNEKIDARAFNLLKSLDIPNRLKRIESILDEDDIDYEKVNGYLDNLKQISLGYLKSMTDETIGSC